MSARRGTLLLAWGNPGRMDDGLGPALAEVAGPWQVRDLVIDSNYQLQIEDAEQAAGFDRVVFVDADRSAPEPFRIQRIHAGRSGISFSSHSVTPEALLALTRDLFHVEPEAWVVGIRGYEFDEFGERLSARACSNLDATASCLRSMLQSDRFHEIRPTRREVSHV